MIIEHIGIEGILDLVLKYHTLEVPKVAGSIPTVVRITFQLARCGLWIYTQSNIKNSTHL